MRVVFVHGWSVTNLNTYGGLPAALARQAGAHDLDLEIDHLYLAKYVSFSDEVKVDDIARGMEHAVRTEILPKLAKNERFACVTHSTGGPVVREWIRRYYAANLRQCPLGHLVMLAPANHGSALAQLGKSRLSRIKAFVVDGVQPGVGVLDWLELGSDQSWDLNRTWLGYDCVAAKLYPFVLVGQTIDRSFYDHLNSYTGEPGSDGVVRAAAANLNYGLLQLTQQGKVLAAAGLETSAPTAFGIVPGRAHSGDDIGIMRSVKVTDTAETHPTLEWLLRCLSVSTPAQYRQLTADLATLTKQTQEAERDVKEKQFFIFEREFKTSRYCMLVVHLRDDRGNRLDNYEVIFTAGPDYDPNHLPEGFFVDRQRNRLNPGTLTYFIDHDVMDAWFRKPEIEGKFGVKVVAQPKDGYAYYDVAEYRGTYDEVKAVFAANRTMMIEVRLTRKVREGVYQLSQDINQNYRKGTNRKQDDFSQQDPGADLPADL